MNDLLLAVSCICKDCLSVITEVEGAIWVQGKSEGCNQAAVDQSVRFYLSHTCFIVPLWVLYF